MEGVQCRTGRIWALLSRHPFVLLKFRNILLHFVTFLPCCVTVLMYGRCFIAFNHDISQLVVIYGAFLAIGCVLPRSDRAPYIPNLNRSSRLIKDVDKGRGHTRWRPISSSSWADSGTSGPRMLQGNMAQTELKITFQAEWPR